MQRHSNKGGGHVEQPIRRHGEEAKGDEEEEKAGFVIGELCHKEIPAEADMQTNKQTNQ